MKKNLILPRVLLSFLAITLGLQTNSTQAMLDLAKKAMTTETAKKWALRGAIASSACLCYRYAPEIVAKYNWKNTEVVRQLGKDPKYSHLPKKDGEDKMHRAVFLTGHNGLDPKPIILGAAQAGTFKAITHTPGNLTGFPIRSESVGGTYDAEFALYPLIKCQEAGCTADVVGLSRGSGTAITAMDMIEYPDKYSRSWKKLGVTKGSLWKTLDYEKIKKIKDNTPMVYINNPFLGLTSFLNCGKTVGTMAKLAIIPFTKFDFQEPMDLLPDLANKGWKVKIITAFNDCDVRNHNDKFLEEICKKDKNWNFFEKENFHHLDYTASVGDIIARTKKKKKK